AAAPGGRAAAGGRGHRSAVGGAGTSNGRGDLRGHGRGDHGAVRHAAGEGLHPAPRVLVRRLAAHPRGGPGHLVHHRRGRGGAGRSLAGRAADRGLHACDDGAVRQGGGGAIPFLAPRRARGRAHTRVRPVLGRDGGAGPVRGRPGLLDRVRRRVLRVRRRVVEGARGVRSPHRAGRRGDVLRSAAPETAAGVLHGGPRRSLPGRRGNVRSRRPGGLG